MFVLPSYSSLVLAKGFVITVYSHVVYPKVNWYAKSCYDYSSGSGWGIKHVKTQYILRGWRAHGNKLFRSLEFFRLFIDHLIYSFDSFILSEKCFITDIVHVSHGNRLIDWLFISQMKIYHSSLDWRSQGPFH